ncbi:hypothetical protein EV652_106300 [Kribbella steppae]|uniref:Uncharacterized protein n=1 Tax=Kribbella steppae TaxID=2512223 RepID=A0A4R2HKJ6_9ACTN|nr:hypothetical protein [Kribbella steppae]TCO28315.1 hypothetical protein EV652_106300 [Kribbella steppae]
MPTTAAPPLALTSLRRLARQRSVRITAAVWLAANVVVLLVAGEALPFGWPGVPGSTVDHVVNTNIGMLGIFGLMAVTCLLTRHRVRPDLADRAPDLATTRRETLLLLAYGALGLVVGFVLARLFGWHPFGLHLAGSIFGTHDHVGPVEAMTWAGYNVVVYAVLPLAYFRRKYSAEQLNLVSSDRRGDARVIVVVLLIESAVQFATLTTAFGQLTTGQYLVGLPLTFVLYLAGAVLPAMIFVYCILVPRFLKLTGSTATTVILGGITYTVLHLWDAWTVLTSPANWLLSIIFLFFTYFGPGMMKTVLTVRTGNAWTHVWAYHAVAPHTLIDAPHVVEIFRVR